MSKCTRRWRRRTSILVDSLAEVPWFSCARSRCRSRRCSHLIFASGGRVAPSSKVSQSEKSGNSCGKSEMHTMSWQFLAL
eukprot:7879114-Pyramimonas_sp.AAC.1